MAAVFKDEMEREFHAFEGRPVFVPGWWGKLRTSQKWLLVFYILLYSVTACTLRVALKDDQYFVHTIKLIGFRDRDSNEWNRRNQRVEYDLSIDIPVGLWSTSPPKTLYSDLLSKHPKRVEDIIKRGTKSAIQLWDYCTNTAHRAVTCHRSAFTLLTLWMLGLTAGPFIFIFSRKWFILTTSGSVLLLISSYSLTYAASVEYDNCIIDRQIDVHDNGRRAYVGFYAKFYAVTFRPAYKLLNGLLVAYIFGYTPMIGVGFVLLYTRLYNL
ncbi:unnamed protein product [Calicophoron daubneyi]|uniref:Uncharacterized protein n=1 Tax=Calicophoron daubneyi TaxID=300641 RepID=A0AAV2TZF4_CALDB